MSCKFGNGSDRDVIVITIALLALNYRSSKSAEYNVLQIMKIRDIQAISFVDNLIIFRAAVHRIG
jgi:hypothetical protein